MVLSGKHHSHLRFAVSQMKIDDWTGVWIGGGAGRTFFNNDPLKDVDLFFSSKYRKHEWVNHMLTIGATQVEDKMLDLNGIKYDFARELYKDTASEFIRYVDFTICGVYFTPWFSATYVPKHLEDIKNRELRCHEGFTPLNSVERAYRMIEKGYKPTDDGKFWAEVHKYIKERS